MTSILTSNATVAIGPPEKFNISATTHTITLMWSPPSYSNLNVTVSNYTVICLLGQHVINHTVTTSTKLKIIGFMQFTNYTCFVSAGTLLGNGPPIAKTIETKRGNVIT